MKVHCDIVYTHCESIYPGNAGFFGSTVKVCCPCNICFVFLCLSSFYAARGMKLQTGAHSETKGSLTLFRSFSLSPAALHLTAHCAVYSYSFPPGSISN